MASVNKVILVGHLGRDPETRAFASGDQICNVRIATTNKWRDKQTQEMREHTEWHSVVFGGKLAEIASQYLRKGSQVYVEGQLRTRDWEQDGVKRYSTEIRADTMQMLGSKQGMGGGDESHAPQRTQQPPPQRQAQGQANSYEAARNGAPPPARAASGFDDMDSDIPW